MNTQLPNIFSAHNRILEIISSCDTSIQLRACYRMIQNFKVMYKDYNHLTLLIVALKNAITSKVVTI